MEQLHYHALLRAQYMLQQCMLRKTDARLEVLALLLQNQHALAHSDLEKELKGKFDRVTIYRTLHTFEEKGIVHSINDLSGAIKYVLCQQPGPKQQHKHVYFNCTACSQTYCLNEVQVPPLSFPSGYQVHQLQFLAHGICETCRATP
ncbi:Fur family transcriptional regulator [Pontibacter sp. CAU 1760]